MPASNPTDRRTGATLVALQFALLGLLALQAVRALRAVNVPVDVPITAAAALALGVWALSANPPGNFNIRPAPRAGGQLVQHGPYRWIRHPMYSTLMLAGLAAVRLCADAPALATWLALVAVLVVKARVEERALVSHFPGYEAYCRRTRRFIPGLL